MRSGGSLSVPFYSRRLVSAPNAGLTAGESYLILDAELLDSAGVTYLVEDDVGDRQWVNAKHFLS